MKATFRIKRPDYLAGHVEHPVMVVAVGKSGYWPSTSGIADDLPAEVAEAALVGSMFGWHVPGAKAAMDYAEGGAA